MEPDEPQEAGLDLDPKTLLAILKRRKWFLLIPTALLLPVVVAVAMLLPPIYRSEGMILIERPNVPPDLIASTVTSFAAERIEVIKQRFMTTENLLKIMDEHDLYPEERKRRPVTELTEEIRADIGVELVEQGLRRDPNVIAFKVAFEHEDATKAQRVASELVSWYLSQNARTRQQQARETAAFLEKELAAVQAEAEALEEELEAFEQKHKQNLPQQIDIYRESLNRLRDEADQLEFTAQTLGERQAYLKRRLADVGRDGAVMIDGEVVLGLRDHLDALKMERARLSVRVTDQHPDLIALTRDIKALEAKLADRDAALDASAQDVERNGASVSRGDPEQAEGATEAEGGSMVAETSHQESDTAGMAAEFFGNEELEAVQRELRLVERRQQAVEADIANVEQKMERATLVRDEYSALRREYDNVLSDYQALRRKELVARMGTSLEMERKSERFSLIEPPQRPSAPEKPNRPLILAGGFVLAFGAGLGSLLLAEILAPALRSAKKLESLTGMQPLVVIPHIRTRREVMRTWLLRGAAAVCVIAVIGAGLAYVHVRVKPLDLVWLGIERKIEARLGPIVN